MQNDLLAMVEEIRVLRLQEEIIQQQKKEMVDQFLQTKELLLKEQEDHQILQNDIAVKAEEWMEERTKTSQFMQEIKLVMSADLEACYDRIIHTAATLVLLRIGISHAKINSMFSTI